jgi:DNA polymerase delta subunit 2
MSTHLLVDYLSGVFGSSNIARVIVAGNAFGNGKRRMFDKHAQTDALRQRNVQAAQRVDTMLTELGATVQVDLMPGEQDPAMLSLPQQPFFHGLLPNASQHASLRRVTNPYACTIDNTLFLGTSGQNVDDAYRYIAPVKRDRMSLAADMLQWRHMAPTAPDTLYAYPYVDKDPFIMEHCPHVYFIGNQPQFETTTIVGDHGQSVRVVLVPKFSTSGTVVLVNLSTLACTSVRIGSQLPQDAMQVGEEDNVEEEEEVDVVIDHEGGDDDE